MLAEVEIGSDKTVRRGARGLQITAQIELTLRRALRAPTSLQTRQV
jgi:hypothetical protein